LAACSSARRSSATGGRAVVSSLRTRINNGADPIDDEIAAELQRVAAGAAKPGPARQLGRVAEPDGWVAPDAQARCTPKPPGVVDRPFAVDEQRVRQLELGQQRAAQPLGRVEGEEQRRTELIDPPPVMEHLHEVRTADQSASVAEEDEEECLTAQVVQPHTPAVKIDQAERARLLADYRRACLSHRAARILPACACIQPAGASPCRCDDRVAAEGSA
jgi:hypothetical protein